MESWRERSLASWIGSVLLAIGAMHLLAAAFAAVHQQIVTYSDREKYPPPGVLVDVGDHQLHLLCVGMGTPTVVLEAAMPGWSAHWAWVQPRAAIDTRVCAYDRSGLGWSEAGQRPRDASRIADELKLLLDAANVAGPYVLVGHSLGGLYVRAFAALHPDDVVGMVLVDATPTDLWSRLPGELALPNNAVLSLLPPLAMLGLTRFYTPFPVDPGLPERQRTEVAALQPTVRVFSTIAAELKAIPASNDEVKAAGSLGDTPLVVVTAGNAYPELAGEVALPARATWAQLQDELVGLSRDGVQRVIADATHESLVYDRDDADATVRAIRDVVDAVRTGTMLTDS